MKEPPNAAATVRLSTRLKAASTTSAAQKLQSNSARQYLVLVHAT